MGNREIVEGLDAAFAASIHFAARPVRQSKGSVSPKWKKPTPQRSSSRPAIRLLPAETGEHAPSDRVGIAVRQGREREQAPADLGVLFALHEILLDGVGE